MTTILWYPIADKCRNNCLYCFEDPSFKRDNSVFDKFNTEKMAKTFNEIMGGERSKNIQGQQIILHGGEILDLPIKDFEFFLSETKKYSEKPAMQTSLGVPLTSEHIRLIKMYGAEVGISVDGPPELNILRGPRDSDGNKEFQKTVSENILKLKNNNINFGTIVILSKANASEDKIDQLVDWCVTSTHGGRFNPLFIPCHEKQKEISKYALTNQELTNAFMKLLFAAIKYPRFDFRLFEEMKSALIGDFRTGCTFNRCDYLTTICKTILPDGEISRCDRCFQDGYYYASEKGTNIRWKMLEQTECKGCKYFVACTGGCPAEGRDGDFRSKTMYCESYYAMYQCIENILRKMFPGIFLTTDIHNYYEDYYLKNKRFNFLARDNYFIDTKERMENSFKLLGWTPDLERRDQIQESKGGYSHMDTNVSECNCGGDKKC